MLQRSCNSYLGRTKVRRPRILVEDDSLDLTTLDLTPQCAGAFDIVVCTGPTGHEHCPLVVDGHCPAGRPDVVVTALGADNPWTDAVRMAWERDEVRVAHVHPDEEPLTWPAHLGAAMRALQCADLEED